jgi:tRNA dimethylallyltransferase
MIPVTVIVGPTASGKTDFAVQLAHKKNAEIINADCMQLYADLPILTARPTIAEQEGVPHHLFGILGPSEKSVVTNWLDKTASIIRENAQHNKHTIIVGGTGFYIDCLIRGISNIPEVSNNTRKKVFDLSQELNDGLYEYVTALDPMVVDLVRNDKQRLMRALEVFLESGRSIREFQGQKQKLINLDPNIMYLNPPRDILYDRINRRFDIMIGNGAIDQVATLINNGVSIDAPVMAAIGAHEIYDYMANAMDYDTCINRAKQYSRNYAKRQITFFNNCVNKWSLN